MTKNQSNYIKLIAIIAMLIDHTGSILFPQQILFRIIGRAAFPLFAFQLGIGYEHTQSFPKYFLRIFIFGVGVQLLYAASIFFFGIDENPLDLNIFFTLTLGLLAIGFFDTRKYTHLIPVFAIPLMAGYFGINLDYGIYGIAMILLLFITRNRPLLLIAAYAMLNLAYYCVTQNFLQPFCLVAALFIVHPLNLKIRIPGYIFYLFYPVHLAILYAVSKFV